MPLGQRLLQPILTNTVLHPRMRRLLYMRHEWWRQLRGQPYQIVVWLRPTDPYSYLLIQKLPKLIDEFDLKLVFKILPYQEPNQFFNYYLRDAWHLAQFHQLQFHHFHPPSEQQCFMASQLILANRHLSTPEFLTLIKQIFSCLWEQQPQKLMTLSLRFQMLSRLSTTKKLQQNQIIFESLKTDNSAILQFQHEYYWSIDELPFLAKRLEELTKKNISHPLCISHDQHCTEQGYLINDWQQLSQIRAQKYELDYYFNFHDPLSYIYLVAIIPLTDYYRIKLNLCPIYLEEDIRATSNGFSLLELSRLQKIAQSYNLEIGPSYILSNQGLQHCLTLFYIALQQDCAQEISLKILENIWSLNKDFSYINHIQDLLTLLNYNTKEFKASLKTEEWRGIIEQYTTKWLQLDLPQLPSFYLQGEKRISLCGAHRLWALEMALIEHMDSAEK